MGTRCHRSVVTPGSAAWRPLGARYAAAERTCIVEILLLMFGSLEHGRREALACQFHHFREVVVFHSPVLACFGVEQPMTHKKFEGLSLDYVRSWCASRNGDRDKPDSRRPRCRRLAQNLTGGLFQVREGNTR